MWESRNYFYASAHMKFNALCLRTKRIRVACPDYNRPPLLCAAGKNIAPEYSGPGTRATGAVLAWFLLVVP